MASTPSEVKGEQASSHQDNPGPQPFDKKLSSSATTASAGSQDNSRGPGAVRFSSKLEEIEPSHSLQTLETESTSPKTAGPISPKEQAELRQFSRTLQDSRLQKKRLCDFSFEPVSLPASRVPSNEPSSRQNSNNTLAQRHNPSIGSVHTPPLTPSGSTSAKNMPSQPDQPSQAQMTPQTSGPQRPPPPTNIEPAGSHLTADSASVSTRPSSSGESSTRPTTYTSSFGNVGDALPKNVPLFSTGAAGDSIPPSRDDSPTGSGAATPAPPYSRPYTPVGDKDDPYARSKRPPQSRNLEAIDPRFIFNGKDNRRHSSYISGSALSNLPRTNSSGELKAQEKQGSGLFAKKEPDEGSGKHSSMADLKRFLRFGHPSKRSSSPSSTKSSQKSDHKSGTRTPSTQQSQNSNVPFADDHGLQSKYGKFGRVLGSGAGGSVRLMKRSSDGVTFAVKQFRDRHAHETEREYAKKVTAEFCIGSTLHHGNIIETLDIIHEKGRWYEVMEYAPFDLFAIVMTGKMSREEIACSFLQIFAGVTYLHSMGLAHRDLKLDNVVVNEHGIMKIIDFGSAIVFRYPFEYDIVLASGIVGSDPYLAPEVYDNSKYDPQPADIWSMGIIFACMSLRRFPWKIPRLTDNSYKLFVATSSPGTTPVDRRTSEQQRPRSIADASSVNDPRRSTGPDSGRQDTDDASVASSKHHHSHHHSHHQENSKDLEVPPKEEPPKQEPQKQEVIKGPWRLLRLLPRESRSIIGRMLEIDPKKRATIEDILADQWVQNSLVCQEENGKFIRAPGHTHTLEPPGPAESPAPSKK